MPVKRLLRTITRLHNTPAKAIFLPARQHPRAALSTEVRVEGHGFNFTARSVQLGSKGMSLEDADQLCLAQPVLLTFALPTGLLVRVGAVVWWKTEELVGVRFDPRNDQAHIEQWINSVAPQTT
jgi:hypothetical protein